MKNKLIIPISAFLLFLISMFGINSIEVPLSASSYPWSRTEDSTNVLDRDFSLNFYENLSKRNRDSKNTPLYKPKPTVIIKDSSSQAGYKKYNDELFLNNSEEITIPEMSNPLKEDFFEQNSSKIINHLVAKQIISPLLRVQATKALKSLHPSNKAMNESSKITLSKYEKNKKTYTKKVPIKKVYSIPKTIDKESIPEIINTEKIINTESVSDTEELTSSITEITKPVKLETTSKFQENAKLIRNYKYPGTQIEESLFLESR